MAKAKTPKQASKKTAKADLRQTQGKPAKVRVGKAVAPAAPAPSVEKKEIIEQFQVKAGDTGSPEVQVALLTKRIEKLVAHLRSNPSDNHSRRGLLGMVSKRRRLLNYLEKRDIKRYKSISQKLRLGK